MKKKKHVVVMGGGTGTYTTLSGLKKHDVDLTAVVSMMDSGGSNRIIRDEFGLLPTSDLRQCMVALADEHTNNEDLRKLFMYRYESGTGISGMTFGNLFMAALTDVYGSQKKAIEKTCELLHVRGKILPVTYDDVQLVARYDNGRQVLGESAIDEPSDEIGSHRITELEVIPQAKANKDALTAIRTADLIVMGPGDLFTSTICNLIIDNVADAVIRSNAKKVFVMNLMTKFGQTNNFKASDHLKEMQKYLSEDALDYCLINKEDTMPGEILDRYKKAKSIEIEDDLQEMFGHTKIIRANVVAKEIYRKPKSDKLVRSLIRHDSDKLAEALVKFL